MAIPCPMRQSRRISSWQSKPFEWLRRQESASTPSPFIGSALGALAVSRHVRTLWVASLHPSASPCRRERHGPCS